MEPKKPLRARKSLKPRKTPRKRPTPKITTLKRSAWKYFSRYVRLRDSKKRGNRWFGKCITCSRKGLIAWVDEMGKLRFVKGWDAGHFVSRGNWFLRHEEENVNLQCNYHCNKMKSGNREKYIPALDEKYGIGTADKLDRLAKENPIYRVKVGELEEIINDSKAAIDFYLKQ